MIMNMAVSIMNQSEFLNSLNEVTQSNDISKKLYNPELDDLYFLYRLARSSCAMSVLEYGSGWSSWALNRALIENKESFQQEIGDGQKLRHPDLWSHLIIDANGEYLDISVSRLDSISVRVSPIVANPRVSKEFSPPICAWDYLPNFAPDLVYLDGPDDDQINGQYLGFSFQGNFTPPVFCDLLKIEYYLWPETLIVIDGRTLQAKYLEEKFERNWQTYTDPFGDRTVMRLSEPLLGPIQRDIFNTRLRISDISMKKEKPEYLRK